MSITRSPVRAVVSSPVHSITGEASTGGGGASPPPPPPPPPPAVVFHDDFSSPGSGWSYFSGGSTTWGTFNSTSGQNVSFYAGAGSGQFGTAQRTETFDVTPGETYTFAFRTHRVGTAGLFSVVNASGGATLASHATNKAANTDHLASFVAPTSGQVRVRVSSQWDYYEYADELAIVPQGSALPWS